MRLKLKPRARKGSYEIDMVNGPLLGKICMFALPLALSGILQLLFNAADIVVWETLRAARLWLRWVPPAR